MPTEQTVQTSSLEKKKSTSSFFGLRKSGKSNSKDLLSTTRVFGVPLDILTDCVNGCPRPIYECLEFLSQKTDTEGLFRLSASVKDLEIARSTIDKGLPLGFSPLAVNSGQEHIAASLVKSFLRELPTPILGTLVDEDVDDLKLFIQNLPSINKSILSLLFKTLYEIHLNQESSKMDASNLAVVIGPNLMWNQDATSGERISPSAATKIAFRLIQNYDEIFGDTECTPKVDEKPPVEPSSQPPESSQTDLDIIVSAIYELQKEIYELKEIVESEITKRESLEEYIKKNIGTITTVDHISASSSEAEVVEEGEEFDHADSVTTEETFTTDITE